MSLVLNSEFYFGVQGFPIAISREGTSRTTSNWPDYTGVEHSHDFCELVLILSGQGMHCLEGNSFPIVAGDIFLLHGNQKHYFHNLQNVELVNVLYSPQQLGLPENELRKLPGYCALFILEPQHRKHHRFSSRLHLQRIELAHAVHIVDKIDSSFKNREAGWEISSLTALQELIIYLSKSYISSSLPDAVALLRLGNVISLLEQDFMKSWTLDELIEKSHMSSVNLIKVFKNATGQTPIEYLISIRLQRAAELLRNSNNSITDIAFQVGFNDSNYFSRLFRVKMKATPREFRLKFKNSTF